MHTAGPICMSRFIAHNVVCTVNAIYAMVMCEFGSVFWIPVFTEKGILKLTLYLTLHLQSVL